jgi:hypothetical protein
MIYMIVTNDVDKRVQERRFDKKSDALAYQAFLEAHGYSKVVLLIGGTMEDIFSVYPEYFQRN